MRRLIGICAAGAAAAVLLAGCGNGAATSPAEPATTAAGKIRVVTSTDVYASIVESIGANRVQVSSLINKPSQDPHSYEATAQDKLAISKAQLGVENGGGYDGFFDQLAGGGTLAEERILNATDISGLRTEANKDDFNEHVWYSLPTAVRVADAVATRLAELDPEAAGIFKDNAAAFKNSAARISEMLAGLKAGHTGQEIAVTEPVPLYLIQEAGLVNKTPAAYSHAIEDGQDVPPAVLQETIELVGSQNTRFLAYNDQTEGPQTQVLKKAAVTAGIPVLNFSETLPAGQDYLTWMAANADSIKKAISQ
ncbi:zinc ABC transporter substrate-binding protein [Paeniglutamicibacter antarcticus]|uniref:Zinc ABC transporter substrate-binding protein n=1 Tax=Arthrobacter terrae TaxID=2935737 RepID=A0A931CUL2_9MICC|nr:zinc ABC transporter substrate-binding protein [Arthrobacter terrae]MBG0741234.1 zinc ABC transporter substrate-binding protein [Arthrobacter terrae]